MARLTRYVCFLYAVDMRPLSRLLAGTLTVTLVLLVFGPFLLCGGGSTNKAEMATCCRAMHFQCHKKDGLSSCCDHETVDALHVTLSIARDGNSVQPQLAWAPLADAVRTDEWHARAGYSTFPLSPIHSPPQSTPLFLRHSTLLI